jgi:hypothetical protein
MNRVVRLHPLASGGRLAIRAIDDLWSEQT